MQWGDNSQSLSDRLPFIWDEWSFGGMGKFFKFLLPLILVVISIVILIAMVAYKNSQQPERKAEISQAVQVDIIVAEVTSTNLTVSSQGTVRPRTETTLVAEVSGKIVSVSADFVAGVGRVFAIGDHDISGTYLSNAPELASAVVGIVPGPAIFFRVGSTLCKNRT